MPSWYRDANAPEPNRPRKVGVCFIVELNGSVLLDRRRDDGALAFTGGSLEEGESVEEALARELLEETGLEPETVVPLGIFSDPSRVVAYPDGVVVRVLTLAFIVEPRAGATPRWSHESLELRVFSREELGKLDIWPAHEPIRDAYLAFDGRLVVA